MNDYNENKLECYTKMRRREKGRNDPLYWETCIKNIFNINNDNKEMSQTKKRVKNGFSQGKIIKLKERLISKNPWLKHYFDVVEFPDGRIGQYNRLVVNDGVEGVVILPILKIKKENNTYEKKVLLINHYRYPVQSWSWECPRGFGNKNERSDESAIRELCEETGYKGNLKSLGKFWENTGICSGQINYYLSNNLKKICVEGLDPKESISELRALPLYKINDWIKKGKIKDMHTIIAIYLARIHQFL